MKKGLSFFRNCICNATHNNSFGSVLTAIHEVNRRLYYIMDDIFVYFYQCLPDPFINTFILWAYIHYLMKNQLLAYLPNTKMECVV